MHPTNTVYSIANLNYLSDQAVSLVQSNLFNPLHSSCREMLWEKRANTFK